MAAPRVARPYRTPRLPDGSTGGGKARAPAKQPNRCTDRANGPRSPLPPEPRRALVAPPDAVHAPRMFHEPSLQRRTLRGGRSRASRCRKAGGRLTRTGRMDDRSRSRSRGGNGHVSRRAGHVGEPPRAYIGRPQDLLLIIFLRLPRVPSLAACQCQCQCQCPFAVPERHRSPSSSSSQSHHHSPKSKPQWSYVHPPPTPPPPLRPEKMAMMVDPPNGIGNHGKHYYTMWQTMFEIDTKYVPIKPIGRGAYGIVCSSINQETNEKVAIKKINNVFDNRVDALRTLRELKLLRHLRHENVIALKDIMMPIHRRSFKDVYLVSELMDTDLHQIVKSSQPLSNDHCQYFLFSCSED
ncbi:hypothetical protein ZWY2020_001721 [Hordeum vulgare]|nr:hypothetical protein ZWY2020_001721 [Hordeum vulgare]